MVAQGHVGFSFLTAEVSNFSLELPDLLLELRLLPLAIRDRLTDPAFNLLNLAALA